LCPGVRSSEPSWAEKGDAEVKVPDDPKLRLELKVKIGALECNAQKAKGGEGVGRLRGHTIGVDFGDAKTGLSVSRGGYAPRPLTVSSCSLAVRSARNGSSSTRCSLLPSVREAKHLFNSKKPKQWRKYIEERYSIEFVV
jgi:hypothetical protein